MQAHTLSGRQLQAWKLRASPASDLHAAPNAARRQSRTVFKRGAAGVVVATAAPARPGTESAAREYTERVVAQEKQYVLQTYARPADIVFTRGEGCVLYDTYGREYLDFFAGIAVNALGHTDSRWLEAVVEQASALAHTSNLFHTVPQVELARRLVEASFADKVFFCNSGTEANEAAIKFARKWAKVKAGLDPYDAASADKGPHELISFTNSFHGRTMGSLTLTYKDQYKTPFAPLVPGARMVPYQDLAAARQAIVKGRTAAVFVEPVQGEGGCTPATAEFLTGLRKACDEAGALLVFDEVQCGLGRTGSLWAYQQYGVEPDLMSLAKPLAGGLPIGAVLLKQHVADVMAPGDHGSTFAGNPLVCHAACATFDIVADPTFLAAVNAKGKRLRAGLREALEGNPHVKEVRGSGLLTGVELDVMAGPVVEEARKRGLLVVTAGKGDVLRMVPPLTVTDSEVDKCVDILSQSIKAVLK